MDDDLSAGARKLIAVAMDEDLPPPSIADGSWEMVVSRLTIEAARPSETLALPPRSMPTSARNWVGIAVLGLVVVVAGGLLWLVLQPKPAVPPMPSSAPAKAVHTPGSHSSSPATTPVDARPAPAPPPAEPSIDPTKLLDDAEAAEPARALELLAQHAELAPLGAGAERRMALRISALCALGRTQDAQADARAFLNKPRAPEWTKHVRASCAGR